MTIQVPSNANVIDISSHTKKSEKNINWIIVTSGTNKEFCLNNNTLDKEKSIVNINKSRCQINKLFINYYVKEDAIDVCRELNLIYNVDIFSIMSFDVNKV